MYASYIKEKTGDFVEEWPNGFVVYSYLNEGLTLYIKDIYVAPAYRKEGVAKGMADAVVAKAKALGAVEVIGSVATAIQGATDSIKVLLAYGMTLQSASPELIVFRKGI